MFGNNVKLDLQFLQLLILLINGIDYSKQAFVYNLIIRMCRNELRCTNVCTYIYIYEHESVIKVPYLRQYNKWPVSDWHVK